MPRIAFVLEGFTPAHGEENPEATLRIVGPQYFTTLGVQMLEGRDFNDEDTSVAIVNQTFVQRLLPNGDVLNRTIKWTGSLAALLGQDKPLRIIGVVADLDDEHLVRSPTPMLYQTARRMGFAGRLFVRTAGEPYALVPAVTRTIRQLAPDQPIERPATFEDVRAEVLSPDRVNALVFSTFAGIALLIAVVGIAGVLAFSVSARTREFGVRLAVGSPPRQILTKVLSEGVAIAGIGVVVGAIGAYALAQLATRFVGHVDLPGVIATIGSMTLLIAAAVTASLIPAARASRVDVLQALRSE
jgi:ABC-type antimicrobial peptide transport system permease subunit